MSTQQAVSPVSRGGRPTKYKPETVDRLLEALADGLTIKQACTASGISDDTLSDWRERHPELGPRLDEAREQARRKALASIKLAGEDGDWRASEAFLKYSFWQDYRQGPAVNVTATATAQTAVVSEEQRARLIELRERITGAKHQPAIEAEVAPTSTPKKLPTNPSDADFERSEPKEGYEGEPWGKMPGVPGLE